MNRFRIIARCGMRGHQVARFGMWAFAAVLTAVAVSPAEAQNNPGDSVFSAGNGLQVHTLNFVFPVRWDGTPGDTAAWDGNTGIHRLLSNNKESETYIPARLEINCDGTRANPGCILMDSVGVRYKGNSTFSANRAKNPFRISFDEYGIDQRWNGIKGFTLNNSNMDASHMAEKIHMDFAVERAKMAGPRMTYAQVQVNGNPHSFYMMGELADGRLLRNHFGDNKGDLFKAIDGLSNNSDFTPGSFDNKRYENKSDSVERGWARLGAVIDAVNGANPAQEMPAHINMNSVYRGIGTDILFSSMDSYIGVGQNYLVYFPEATGARMEWILWDASLSFGKMTAFFGGGGGGGFPGFPGGGGGGGTQGTACSNTATNPIACGQSSKPLAHKIMTTESLKQDYLRTLWFLYKAYFEGPWLNARIDSVATLIRPYLAADTKKLSDMNSFESNINTLKTFVTNRQASVATQFTDHGITAETAIRAGDVVINEIAAAQGWVEVYNTRDYAIDLAGHTLSDNPAQAGTWAFPLESFVPPRGHLVVRLQGGTIGSHGPAPFSLPAAGGHVRLSRVSGSVVDSVTFEARVGDSTVARAYDGAAAFVNGFPTPGAANISAVDAPVRVVPGRIRINEFMADNDSIKSPAGNNADWIELYNTSAEAISLTGMHLSDNPANPSKWQFPVGASIPANGYLVVWAYDTTASGSLFARWALSKDGEHIRLSNADSSIVDSVTFGPQSSNRTTARIPNGTGAFSSACLPTLGATNTCVVTATIAAAAAEDRGFALVRGGAGRVEARFALERAGHVRLSVHDGRGREVAVLAQGRFQAGEHRKTFDLGALPGGLYVFRLRAGDVEHVRAGVLMK